MIKCKNKYTSLSILNSKAPFIDINYEMPPLDTLCLVKIKIDNKKAKEVFGIWGRNKVIRIGHIEPDEIEVQGHFSSYTKDWVFPSFVLNPLFEKITHWKAVKVKILVAKIQK